MSRLSSQQMLYCRPLNSYVSRTMLETNTSSEFEDIRPYEDAEVAEVLARLQADEELIDTLLKMQFGLLLPPFSWLLRKMASAYLRRKLKHVKTVFDLQKVIRPYVERMVQKTTGGFTVSGVENIDPEKSYLFISNHRDIALDPALLNYALVQNNMNTVRIAIGDNLLSRPFISDLMRLNKSFIVNRSATAPRQIFKATKQLSAYIRHSVVNDKSSVWIAQREGRAKNGADITEPVIIKMLAMTKAKKTEALHETIRNLHIVPVAISYEYDPCDAAKARELSIKSDGGSYEKGEQEDAQSIADGIRGEKGRVHIAIGSELVADFQTVEEVAAAIDAQIVSLYQLFPSNYYAYDAVYNSDSQAQALAEKHGWLMPGMRSQRAFFEARAENIEASHRPFMLKMYAECLKRKLEYGVL